MRFFKSKPKVNLAEQLEIVFIKFKPATRIKYRRLWLKWQEFVKNISENSVSYSHAIKYYQIMASRAGESKDQITKGTLRHNIVVLKACYDHLIDLGVVKENPFKKVLDSIPTQPTGIKRPTGLVPDWVISKILHNASDLTRAGVRNKAFFSVLFGCGVRISECLGLRLSSLRRTDKGTVFLFLSDTKSGKPQKVACPEWTAKALDELIRQRKEERASDESMLFVQYKTSNDNFKWSNSSASKLFTREIRKAGYKERVSPHFARATAITKLLEQGFSYKQVQDFSRHSSVSLIELYDKRRYEVDNAANLNISYEK